MTNTSHTLPNMSANTINHSMAELGKNDKYGKPQARVVLGLVLQGVADMFEKLPELERVYFDFASGNMRDCIRSNQDRKEYVAHIKHGGRESSQRNMDIKFDNGMAGVRKRCGENASAIEALQTVFDGNERYVDRWWHKEAIGCMIEHPAERWSAEMIAKAKAKAEAANMQADTPQAPKQSKPRMRP
jgi:hypothetical protein